jgi:hypothetical protein
MPGGRKAKCPPRFDGDSPRPVCSVHGTAMSWHRDKRTTSDGFWTCLTARAKRDTSPCIDCGTPSYGARCRACAATARRDDPVRFGLNSRRAAEVRASLMIAAVRCAAMNGVCSGKLVLVMRDDAPAEHVRHDENGVPYYVGPRARDGYKWVCTQHARDPVPGVAVSMRGANDSQTAQA